MAADLNVDDIEIYRDGPSMMKIVKKIDTEIQNEMNCKNILKIFYK